MLIGVKNITLTYFNPTQDLAYFGEIIHSNIVVLIFHKDHPKCIPARISQNKKKVIYSACTYSVLKYHL